MAAGGATATAATQTARTPPRALDEPYRMDSAAAAARDPPCACQSSLLTTTESSASILRLTLPRSARRTTACRSRSVRGPPGAIAAALSHGDGRSAACATPFTICCGLPLGRAAAAAASGQDGRRPGTAGALQGRGVRVRGACASVGWGLRLSIGQCDPGCGGGCCCISLRLVDAVPVPQVLSDEELRAEHDDEVEAFQEDYPGLWKPFSGSK